MGIVRDELMASCEEARKRYVQAREQVNRIKAALESAIELERGTYKAFQDTVNALALHDSRKGN